MEIILYDFVKKDNSTGRPTDTGVTKVGTLKAPVSVLNPVVTFTNNYAREDDSLAVKFNYAYITAYNRYYWIVDKVVDQTGLITFSMTIDLLATYGENIHETTAYVSRAQSEFNGDYADGSYVTSAHPTVVRQTIPYAMGDMSSGCFIIGTSSPVSNGITYWYFEAAAFKTLINVMNDTAKLCKLLGQDVSSTDVVTTLTDSVKGLTSQMYISMYNPVQFIRSVVFYPKTPTFRFTAAIPFVLGDITFTGVTGATVAAYPMEDKSYFGSYGIATATGGQIISCTVPKHPQAASRGNYLKQPPFSQYHVSLPGFGEFDLDATLLADVSTLYFKMITDFRDGSAVCYVDSDTSGWGKIAQVHGKCGITWELGQRSADVSKDSLMVSAAASGMNALTGLFGGSSGEAAAPTAVPLPQEGQSNWEYGWSVVGSLQQQRGQAMSNAVSKATTTIKDMASDFIDGLRMVTHMSFVGSAGTVAEFLADAYIALYYFSQAAERIDDIGRPLNASKKLGDLTGFAMCVNPHCLPEKCTKAETDGINAQLAAGVTLDWSGYDFGGG